MSKRTPGLWMIAGPEVAYNCPTRDCPYWADAAVIQVGTGRLIAATPDGHASGQGENLANARLIARAPELEATNADLLAALKAIADSDTVEQLRLLHELGKQAEETRYASGAEAQQPEAYRTVGDYESDARGFWPAKMGLVRQLASAAIERTKGATT